MYSDDFYQEHYPHWIEKPRVKKEYWFELYNERYELIESHLPKLSRRILDVGSFLGLFLKVGQDRGWDVLGIEPSDPARDHASAAGIRTLPKLFQDHSINDLGTFDVVNLSLTLEHIDDPASLLAIAYEFLNPGGLISLEVPNEFNLIQIAARHVLGVHKYWIAPPHYINYFTPDTLGNLLQSTGLKVVHRTTSFPMGFFLLMGQNYIGNDAVGRECHSQQMPLEPNLKSAGLELFKTELYELFAKHGTGRELIMFGQK